MIDLAPLPHDRRNFVHKRIGRAVGGFVSSGFNPVAALGGFLASDRPPARNTVPRSQTARPSVRSAAGRRLGQRLKFTGTRNVGTPGTGMQLAGQRGECPGLFSIKNPVGPGCIDLGALPPGGDPATTPGFGGAGGPSGATVMGQFGAALVPGSRIIDRADCTFGGTVRGMVVGSDGLCYNKSQISNKERMWPVGRRPLLTGGDMAAISKAARAAGRLERTTKRLQKIGLMKRPAKGPSRRQIAAEVRTEMHHSK